MTLVYSIACGPAYEPFSKNVQRTLDWGDCLMQGPCKPSSNNSVKRPAKAPRAGTDPFQTLYNSGHVAFDVLEKKEAFELVADAPGFDVSDILVELHDKVLIVAGNRQQAQQQQQQQQGQQPTATAAQQQKAEAAAEEQKAEAAAEEQKEPRQQASASPKGSPKGLKKGFLVKSPPASQPPSQPSSQPPSQPSSPKPQQAAPQQPQQPQPAAAAQEQEPAKVWRRERRVQPFIRAFALPDNVEPDGITASLDKGVLTVRVAKVPEPPKPQPRRIVVRSAA